MNIDKLYVDLCRKVMPMEREIADLKAKLAESESQAAATREALDEARHFALAWDGVNAVRCIEAALSSAAGASLLSRLQEQEEVIGVYEDALQKINAKVQNHEIPTSIPPADKELLAWMTLASNRRQIAREALAKAKELRK